MSWVETESLSFLARHENVDETTAERVLDRLEDLRLDLEDRFDRVPDGITIIVHPSGAWLSAAHPFLPAARLAAAPAGRRYLAGWAMAAEVHVLNDEHAQRRAAGEDSLAAMLGTAERLYVQIVLGQNNDRLPPPWGMRRFARYLQWAWLIEGGAQYFAGQASLFRAAVSRRLREGGQPAFPPSARDAIILGGTVFGLLEQTHGPDACERLVSRLHREGASANLEMAFDARMSEIESEWRRYLRGLPARRAGVESPDNEPRFDEFDFSAGDSVERDRPA